MTRFPKTPPVPREQLLARMTWKMTVRGVLLAVVAAAAMLVGTQADGAVHSILRGAGTGILTALPLFFAGMVWRMYGRMDEFARLQLVQAAAVAFLFTMILSGGLIALQAWLKFPAPAWVFYGVGMGAWLVATLVQHARASRSGGEA